MSEAARIVDRRALSLIVVCLASPLAATADPQRQTLPPLVHKTARQYPMCPGGPPPKAPARVIDFSQPVDDVLLTRAWDAGIRVIFRYYDWKGAAPQPAGNQCKMGARTKFNRQFELPWRPGQTLPGKTLTDEERQRIHAKGFSIGIVFQHCHAETFADRTRARYDANRVLELANALQQPKNTTIFFGVDFNTIGSEIAPIKRYFKVLNTLIKPRGYKIGVYGNGYTCQALKEEGLASYCWLSQSIGFQDSQAYQQSEDWDIKQCATRRPYGNSTIDFDVDVINPSTKNIGLWKPR